MDFSNLLPLLFFGPIVLIIAGVVIYAVLAEKKRAEAWQEIAASLGFQYAKRDPALVESLGAMKIFSRGHSRRAKNVLIGEANGIEITLADYQYTTGSGKNSTTHNQTVCVLRADHLSLPHCYLRRQIKFFDFLGKMFGGQDINFEEDPEFSEAFVLQGEDESAVRDVFDSEARGYFLDLQHSEKARALVFEAGGNTLVIHRGSRIKPDEAQDLMADGFGVLQLFTKGD